MQSIFVSLLLLCQLSTLFAQVVDVDPYTGRPNVTIPLWELKSGSLTFPIVLSYSANGLKREPNMGPVGIEWNLSTGFISREVRGLPDDHSSTGTTSRQGWLTNGVCTTIGNFVPSADDNLDDCTDEAADFDFLNSLGGFTGSVIKDTEPDVFHINAPGLSCSFIYDNNGQIAFLTKQDYKINHTTDTNGEIISFTVTNESGNVYVFGNPVKSTTKTNSSNESAITHFKYGYNLYKEWVVYNSVWNLLSIESLSGDQITFEYEPLPPPILSNGALLLPLSNKTEPVCAYFYNSADDTYLKKDQYTETNTLYPVPVFSRAIGKMETVQVNTSSILLPVVEDIELKQSIIGGIEVINTSNEEHTLLRKFDFGYDVVNKSIFLTSVTESSQFRSLPPYRFTYYGLDFVNESVTWNWQPDESDEDKDDYKDEFGFFNTSIVTPGPFRVYVYPELTGFNRLRRNPIANSSTPGFYTFGLSSRENSEQLSTSMINEIFLPGGGSNRVFYEPNVYRDEVAQTDNYGGGLRVKRIEYHDGINHINDVVTNYSYEQEDGTSSGILLYRPHYAFLSNFYKNPVTNEELHYHQLITQSLSTEQLLKRLIVLTKHPLNDFEPGSQVAYKRAIVSNEGAGKTVYEFDIPAPYGTETEDDWSATRNKIARSFPSQATSIIAHPVGSIIGSYVYPFAPVPNLDYRRGLLRKTSLYDNNNKLVKQTEHEYILLNDPLKVYGLRLDQHKTFLTYTLTLNSETNPYSVTDTYERPMFIYSRYEINTNVRPRLLRTTQKTFDDTNSAAFVSQTQEYAYSSASHDLVTRVTSTSADGIEYSTNHKYVNDYSVTAPWAQQDDMSQSIIKLKERNINQPIEIWHTIKEGSGNPKAVKAALSLLAYDPVSDNVLLKKRLSFTGSPLADFQSSAISNSGGNSSFSWDPRYDQFTELFHYDASGTARSTLDHLRNKSSVHTDEEKMFTKIKIANALADEVAYSDFESSSGFDFTYVGGTASYVTGRTLGKGLNLPVGSVYKLTKTLRKSEGQFYTFSCWIKSTATGSLTVRVSDDVHADVISSLSFINTNSTWKFFAVKIPVTSFDATITVEATTNTAVQIDEVLFYPASASVVTYAYNSDHKVVSETNGRGVSTFFEYDDLGKLINVRDMDNNIIKTYTYQIKDSDFLDYVLYVSTPASLYVNTPSTLTSSRNFPDAVYKWKIVSLADHQSNPELISDFSSTITITGSNQLVHTFAAVGSYLINLQVTYQGITKTANHIKTVSVVNPPLSGSICSNRPVNMDVCYPIPIIEECTPSTTGMVLKATASNGSGSYSYAWRRSDVPGVIGTGQTYTVASDFAVTRNYTCTITDQVTGLSTSANWQVKTYASTPSCSIPNED